MTQLVHLDRFQTKKGSKPIEWKSSDWPTSSEWKTTEHMERDVLHPSVSSNIMRVSTSFLISSKDEGRSLDRKFTRRKSRVRTVFVHRFSQLHSSRHAFYSRARELERDWNTQKSLYFLTPSAATCDDARRLGVGTQGREASATSINRKRGYKVARSRPRE